MKMSIPLRRVALFLSGLVLLGLSACASAKPGPTTKTIHTITIHYDAGTKQWNYTIVPGGNDARNARVKRKDTVQWKCEDGAWTVYFKGPTPLADQYGKELPYVSGAAGATAGGEVVDKVKTGEAFSYGVSVLLPGVKDPVIDDPRIIIEN